MLIQVGIPNNAHAIPDSTTECGIKVRSKPANRKQAEEGVRHVYRAGGVPQPEIFLWFDDLMEALLALEQLSDYRHSKPWPSVAGPGSW